MYIKYVKYEMMSIQKNNERIYVDTQIRHIGYLNQIFQWPSNMSLQKLNKANSKQSVNVAQFQACINI